MLVIGVLLDLAPARELIFLTAPAGLFAVALTAWLVMFDARRRGEALFLADLGVSDGGLVLLASAPPLLAELVMRGVGAP